MCVFVFSFVIVGVGVGVAAAVVFVALCFCYRCVSYGIPPIIVSPVIPAAAVTGLSISREEGTARWLYHPT